MKSGSVANGTMRIGELARLAGVSTDTLRHYESSGLLPTVPRSISGYRQYPTHALQRVRVIRGALSLGFSIEELRTIFGERDSGGTPCWRVRDLAAKKLSALEAELKNMKAWRNELRSALGNWERLVNETPKGKRAGLLEAFAKDTEKSARSARPTLLCGNRSQGKKL